MQINEKCFHKDNTINLIAEAVKIFALENIGASSGDKFLGGNADDFVEYVSSEVDWAWEGIIGSGWDEDKAEDLMTAEFTGTAEAFVAKGSKFWGPIIIKEYPGIFEMGHHMRLDFIDLSRHLRINAQAKLNAKNSRSWGSAQSFKNYMSR
jgi:hypothetical protein